MQINSVIKNLAILASGTALAQVINFCFVPVITRLYGPDAYGMMGGFMAIVNILIPISALSYPIAIVLPKHDMLANRIASLSVLIGVFWAVVLLVLIIINNIFDFSIVKYPLWYILLLPLVTIFLPFQQIGQQWLIRKREYKSIAKISFFQAIVINILRTSGGLIFASAKTLVIMTALGVVFQAGQFYYRSIKTGIKFDWRRLSRARVMDTSRIFYDFPIYRTPQVLVNAISQSLPVFILGFFFGTTVVGYYVLAQTLLTAPVTLLSTSISNIFYPSIVARISNNMNVRNYLLKAIGSLFTISCIIYVPLIFLATKLFEFAFGATWIQAGEFAEWMAIYCIFWLSARPAMDTIPPLKIQKYFLIYEIISFAARGSSLALGYYFYKSPIACIALYSLVNGLSYASLIFFVAKRAGNNDKKTI